MAKKKKRKASVGTWLIRELYMSRAYLSLTGFAPQLLVLFLSKRRIDINHNCLNSGNINMTYAELENIFNQGNHNKLLRKDGISKPRIVRGFDELLAKGFIKVVHQGGAYKQDKTIFALTEDWRLWKPGAVFYERPVDTRERGFRKSKIKVTHESVPIHTHENVP